MARVSSLTVATVSAAVEAIKARGERVSLRTVRGELGEGSLTTIQRLLGEIGEDRPTAVIQVKKAESTTLPDRVAQAINAEIEEAKEAVRAEMQEVIDRLTADLEATMKEVDRINNVLEGKEEQLSDMATREAVAVNRNAHIEKELENLQQYLKETQKELNKEREARHVAELDAAKQAGLAQRMKDVAVELKKKMEESADKPSGMKRTPVKAGTGEK